MDRRATLTAAGVINPAADKEALWFLMKLDQSRHGDMLYKLTNDATRGTPSPATLDEAYVQEPRKGDGESESAVYVIADTLRKKKAVQFGKRRLGSASCARRRKGLSGYREVEEKRSTGSNGIDRSITRTIGKAMPTTSVRLRRTNAWKGDGYGEQGRRYGVQDHSIHGPPKGCVGNNGLYMSS